MRHADPERCIVVSCPVAFRNFYRRQITIEEWARADLNEGVMFEFNAAVIVLNYFV